MTDADPRSDEQGARDVLADTLAQLRARSDAIKDQLRNLKLARYELPDIDDQFRDLVDWASRQGLERRPLRIQLRRTRGWRKPPGAITVARPTIYGNPFPVIDGDPTAVVARYRGWLTNKLANPDVLPWRPNQADIDALRGHDLACWCPLDQPCHADVLLELANQRPATNRPGFVAGSNHSGVIPP
jgi:hypothetical protein